MLCILPCLFLHPCAHRDTPVQSQNRAAFPPFPELYFILAVDTVAFTEKLINSVEIL